MSPEMTSLVQVSLGALTPAVLGFAAFVANKLVSVLHDRFKVQFTDQQVKALHDAADTAAGIAVTMLSRGVIGPDALHPNDKTIIALAANAVNAVATASGAQNTTVMDMAQIVVGRIGTLISADPTIQTIPTTTAMPLHALATQETTNAKAA